VGRLLRHRRWQQDERHDRTGLVLVSNLSLVWSSVRGSAASSLDKVAGVVEVWYAGSAGHKALANILLGDVNPSGKLAMTFPKAEADLPRPLIAPLPPNDEGQGHYAVNSETRVSSYAIHYDEGSEVGYKWYEAQHKQPLFPFGFGLSYTSYAYSGLSVDSSAKTVRFTVKNTGKRTGTEIAEVYATLPKKADESFKR
jgi:beta-glucosidase